MRKVKSDYESILFYLLLLTVSMTLLLQGCSERDEIFVPEELNQEDDHEEPVEEDVVVLKPALQFLQHLKAWPPALLWLTVTLGWRKRVRVKRLKLRVTTRQTPLLPDGAMAM